MNWINAQVMEIFVRGYLVYLSYVSQAISGFPGIFLAQRRITERGLQSAADESLPSDFRIDPQ